jgi:hypothetical protein
MGVYCQSQSACIAVGDYSHEDQAPLAEHWNGNAWFLQSATDPLEGPSTQTESLESVSCKSPNGCVGVGYYYLEGNKTNTGPTVNPPPTSSNTAGRFIRDYRADPPKKLARASKP